MYDLDTDGMSTAVSLDISIMLANWYNVVDTVIFTLVCVQSCRFINAFCQQTYYVCFSSLRLSHCSHRRFIPHQN